MGFFVDEVFAGLLAVGRFFTALELWNDRVGFVVLVRGFVRGAGNDQRCARFVDEDGIDLVDDGKVVIALHASREVELHVVAQIIKAEFVIRAVGDVGGIGSLALEVIHVVLNTANLEAEEAMNLTHPFGVARGEIIVDGDDVDAASRQRVEVSRQGRDQRLAFTGAHLCDFAFVQYQTADQLHVEVTHAGGSDAGFAHGGESLGQNLVQNLLLETLPLCLITGFCQGGLDPFLESRGARAQFIVRKLLDRRLKCVDFPDDRLNSLEIPLIAAAKNFS